MTDGAAGAVTPGAERPHRLKKRRDFLAAAGGRRFHTDRLTAQGRLRDPDEMRGTAPAQGLHVGFTITKRVGHATERNRIRRRLRAAVERAALGLSDKPADIVLIGRRPALSAPFETLVDDLRRALGTVTKPRLAKPPPAKLHPAKPHPAKRPSDAAAPGAEPREEAHVRRRGRSGRSAKTQTSTSAAHGSTDG